MAEPESKASGFNSAVLALRTMVPVDAFERMLSTLPAETAEIIRHPALPLEWIPVRHFRALVTGALEQLFGGDEARLGEWGCQAVRHDLRTIYRMFIRFLSPQFVIERAARLWATYQRNFGNVYAEPDGENAAIVTYERLPAEHMTSAFWAYQRGCLRGVMEATGMKQIAVEIVAGGGGAAHARIRVSWS